MNKAIIVGNITKDLELKTTNDGKHVLEFSLACNESKDEVNYIECVAWEKNADNISQYCGKGAKLLVEGKIKTRKWQDQNGNNRYRTFVLVDRIEFMSKPNNYSSQVETRYNEPQNAPQRVEPTPVDNSPREYYPRQTQLTDERGNDVSGYRSQEPNDTIDINTDDLPFY